LDIRPARPTDAQALAALSSQLGYPVAVGSLTDRLDRLLGRADQVVMVACAGSDGVVGWIHGADEELLEAERRCEILGLVVSHTRRRQRVGQRLVEAVEQWASTRGLVEMSVRSDIVRAESHPFYQRVGYERAKTQHVYRKRLPPRRDA
jgi:GNAT superfamily N-acetyltransferase